MKTGRQTPVHPQVMYSPLPPGPLFLLEKLGFSGEKPGLSDEPRFQSAKPGLSDAFVLSGEKPSLSGEKPSLSEKNLVYLIVVIFACPNFR